MFASGYDIEIIKRRGRWVSDSFSFYLWGDDRVLDTVGKGMLNSTGLLDQLQKQSARDLLKEEGFRSGRAGGKRGMSRQLDTPEEVTKTTVWRAMGREVETAHRATGVLQEEEEKIHWDGEIEGRSRGRFPKLCQCYAGTVMRCTVKRTGLYH